MYVERKGSEYRLRMAQLDDDSELGRRGDKVIYKGRKAIQSVAVTGDGGLIAFVAEGYGGKNDVYLLDVQDDLAVIQQQHVTGPDVLVQIGIGNRNALRGARVLVERRIEEEAVAVLQQHLAVTKPPDADLRALQVAHDGDVPAAFFRGAAQRLDARPLLRFGAMGEIDPHDVEPAADHALEYRRIVGGRAQGGNDFGAALHDGTYCSATTGLSPLFEDGDCRQRLTFHELEEGAAACRDVGNPAADPVFFDGGQGIAAAGDGKCRAVGDRFRDDARALAELVELEHAHGPVPDDRAGTGNDPRIFRGRFGADIQDQVLGAHTVHGMIDRGLIVDVDHMSVAARRSALDLLEAARHSGVISSHSWSTPEAYPRIYALGGFTAPYAGGSTGFVDQWRDRQEVIDPRFRTLEEDQISSKAHPRDLVTVADHEAEVLITAALRAAYPRALVLGEEASAQEPGLLDDFRAAEHAFTVDPVDGTRNFVHGSPDHAVMVGEVRAGQTVRAWIWQPQHGVGYVAEQGAGAWRDGERLAPLVVGPDPQQWRVRTSDPRRIGRALGPTPPMELTWVSCGIDYPKLAEGACDALVYRGTRPWDHVPGSLLLAEVGGAVGDPDEAPLEGTLADAFRTHAHRFTVLVRGSLEGERREVVEHILEVHRPAHTLVDICPLGAGMRLGRGLHVGISSGIGRTGGFRTLHLGDSVLGRDGILGRPTAGTAVESSRLGRDSRVG